MNLLNNKHIDTSRFTSYITTEINLTTAQQHLRPLLNGEQLIHQSPNVLLYEQLNGTNPLRGLLTITTFKLSFTPAGGIAHHTTAYCQNSALLGPYEVCLSAIDAIYHVNGTKKKFSPGHNIAGKIKQLQIVCKNMRVLWFSFKYSDKHSGRQVTNTLLHHVHPKRHSLLFAYDYITPHINNAHKTRLFRSLDDWQMELRRTGIDACQLWRVTVVNESFDPCPQLARHLVVPRSVTDAHLLQSLRSFRRECFPVWTWGTGDGAALVRMADLLATVSDRTQENTLLEKVRESHPGKRAPEILYLDRDCPSPSQIQLSYIKLRDLCTPTTRAQLRAQDARFHSLLDATRWLHYVSQCLKTAVTGARILTGTTGSGGGGRTVVLQEGNGQDMNCVIASLIQILLDPHARTITGFQSLVQKEWIAMGHPFSTRLGHTLASSPPTHDPGAAPLLLLFLDCVQQMVRQCPPAFQYTCTYLCTVWDGAHLTAHETFLFDSEHARVLAEHGRRTPFASLWGWRAQFPLRRDIAQFVNPLYDDARAERVLDVRTGVSCVEIWAQCYFRWLPCLEVQRGGAQHADIAMRFVANQINALRHQLQSPGRHSTRNGTSDDDDDDDDDHNNDHDIIGTTEEDAMLAYLGNVNSFYPFSVKTVGSSGGGGDGDKRRDTMLLDNGDQLLDVVDTQSQSSD